MENKASAEVISMDEFRNGMFTPVVAPTKKNYCDTCRYHSFGRCHRFPPVPAGGEFWFPEVNEHDWCGEWKPS